MKVHVAICPKRSVMCGLPAVALDASQLYWWPAMHSNAALPSSQVLSATYAIGCVCVV